MPAVIFFACLDLEQKSLFMDGHYLTSLQWQLLQFELEQDAHPDELETEPEDGVKFVPFLNRQADIKRSRFFPLHLGHETLSPFLKTSNSKFS